MGLRYHRRTQPEAEPYASIIQRILADHAGRAPDNGEIAPILVADHTNNHYLVLDQGWEGSTRIHDIVLHSELHHLNHALPEWG